MNVHGLGVPFGITFGHLGSSWDPFWSNFCSLRALLGTLWAHFLCSKMGWGAKGAPRGTTTKKKLTHLETILGPKIIKSRFQRHPKTSSEICLEKVLLKGVILRSSTCLNCVRGLKNQGFDVFRKGPKNEPNRHPFWHHF